MGTEHARAIPDAVTEVREDLYELDKRTYLAIDHHCIAPGCTCGDVRFGFFDITGDRNVELDGGMLVDISHDSPARYEGSAASRGLVVRLWEAFQRPSRRG